MSQEEKWGTSPGGLLRS